MRFRIFLLAFFAVCTAHAASWERDFPKAYDAERNGKLADLIRIERRFSNPALLPYLQFWRLNLTLDSTADEVIRDFIARNTDSPLSDRLRRAWLKKLGERGDWDTLLSEFPLVVVPDTALTCYALRARVLRNEPAAEREGLRLWYTGKDLPESCTALFEELAQRRVLGSEDVWRRLRLAFGEGNLGVARHVAEFLPEQDRPSVSDIDDAASHPLSWLSAQGTDMENRGRRELLFLSLESLARDDPDAAVGKLSTVPLPIADARYALGRIALRAARSHHPNALEWFRAAGAELTDAQLCWKVRAALRRDAWADVLAAVSAMSEKTADDPAWRYWKARALREQGRLAEANVLLAALSREPNFYGQLALEEVGAVASAPAPAWKPGDADISDIRHVPGIARALMLNSIGMGFDANAEWEWATRNFDDRRLLTAATLALREGWVDRAIRTADQTKEIHDFELGYPAPYRNEARREARKSGLDEAWVFGMIRQESRFVPHARSSSGAQGLMQIMPETARWIARRLGFRIRDAKAMHEPGKNIAYGTYYLRYVLDRLDHHPVLATAAYNAGPRRAKRWQAERPLEGAIYTETIPFVETREYVKKVMLNAVRYASLFSRPEPTLGERLGIIPARAGEPPTDRAAVNLPQ